MPQTPPPKTNLLPILILITFVLVLSISATTYLISTTENSMEEISTTAPAITPAPTPIAHYSPPTIAKNEAYTIIFVGDSMVRALGENFDELRKDLTTYYPDSVFGLFNLGFGSTNLLSLDERLNTQTTYDGQTYQPIFARQFDVIIIGSFAYNPLSQYPLEEGLRLQTQTLDKTVLELVQNRPHSVIVFLAEIAPSLEKYAQGQVYLSPESRAQWASERRAYLENHIAYAKTHNIPLINVYQKTLLENGVADLQYINPSDYIHPSAAGVAFMSQEIAGYLSTIIPQ